MTMEERVSNFVNELKGHFSKRDNDFKVKVKYNELDDVYFIYHNIRKLKKNDAFVFFSSEKMDEHFFRHGVLNVCFNYNHEFAKELEALVSTSKTDILDPMRELGRRDAKALEKVSDDKTQFFYHNDKVLGQNSFRTQD